MSSDKQNPAPAVNVKTAIQKATERGSFSGLKTNEINSAISTFRNAIAQALPKHLTPERMIQLATTIISRNPAIADCTPSSIIGAVMHASSLGLNPILGECYFVPYNKSVTGADGSKKWIKECQFQIGYKGQIVLARRSNEIKTIYAEVVRRGDKFDYELGLEPFLKHKPDPDKSDNEITHVYAVAQYVNGGNNFVVLSKKQVESYRKRSQTQKGGEVASGIWATDYDAMAKKTAILRLSVYLPKSDELLSGQNTDGGIVRVESAFSNNNEGILVEAIEVPLQQIPEINPVAPTEKKDAKKKTDSESREGDL